MRMRPPDAATLLDVLRTRATLQGAQTAYTFLGADDEAACPRMTWGGLHARSGAIARAVAERVEPGARVLMLFPPGLDFVAAFFGVLAAGAVAVPSYPPATGRVDRTASRLNGIIGDAAVSLVLAPPGVRVRSAALASAVPALECLPWLALDDPLPLGLDPPRPPTRDDLALLQYTSGSTSAPRGVMVTHGNLLSNLAHAAQLAGHDEHTVAVSWLPVNHDMGLIDGVLQPAYSGFPVYLMSPAAFLQRPSRWLQAISRVGATHSGGPNFAYDLCVRRVADEDRRTLDLSTWRIAYNGSEPVRERTLREFHRAFAACGFRPEAFRPAYGLAESTLLVAATGAGTGARVLPVEREALGRGRVATPPRVADDTTLLVSSGTTDGPSHIVVVDPATSHAADPGCVGEIWVSGPSVARGYWRRPHDTTRTFHARLQGTHQGPFLRTGDLGFVHEGHLFITGRLKDVLIIRGVKHYPQDVELTVESAQPLVRPGGCAVFAFPDADSETVAVLAEVAATARTLLAGDLDRLVEGIRCAIVNRHHVPVAAVGLVGPGTLPKTSSGKLQRYTCREGYLQRAFELLADWSIGPAGLERAAS